MAFLQFFALFAMLVAVSSTHDAGKFIKTIPTISNSLINLGKMDITMHFTGQGLDSHHAEAKHAKIKKPEVLAPKPMEQPCLCSAFKSLRSSFLSDPDEIISKILKSNDLFKDTTSHVCCESQEHEQESTLLFEMLPHNLNPSNIQRSVAPIMNFPIIDQLFNKGSGSKSKGVEILLFPKRKDMLNFEFPNFTPKNKEQTSTGESQNLKSRDHNLPSASVKKDLAVFEKQKDLETVEEEALKTVTPANNIASNNNNAL